MTGIELVAPRLLLERAADGRTNWTFTPPAAAVPSAEGESPAAPAAPTATPLAIDRATVVRGTVVWIDHATARGAR